MLASSSKVLAEAADGYAVSAVACRVDDADVVGAGLNGNAAVASVIQVAEGHILHIHSVYLALGAEKP